MMKLSSLAIGWLIFRMGSVAPLFTSKSLRKLTKRDKFAAIVITAICTMAELIVINKLQWLGLISIVIIEVSLLTIGVITITSLIRTYYKEEEEDCSRDI